MAATVPRDPDLLVPDGSDLEDPNNLIRNAYPVSSSHWEAMGRSMNWLYGHGAQLVCGNSTNGSGYGAPTSPIQFRSRLLGSELLSDPPSRAWAIALWADNAVEATVTFQISGDAHNVFVLTMPKVFLFTEVVSGTLPSPPVIGFDITWSGSDEVYIDTVSCFEVPLALFQDADAMEIDSLKDRAPIYYDSVTDHRSLLGVIQAWNDDKPGRRRTIFSWYNENAVTSTDTAFTGSSNVFHLDPALQARRLLSGDTARTIDWAAYVDADGGDGEIRLTTAAGSDTVTISVGAPHWVTGTIDVETDDPDRYPTDGGIRGGTRDSCVVEIRRTTGTQVQIYALVIGDA